MTQKFYAAIKLISGEELLSLVKTITHEEQSTHIVLISPLVVESIEIPGMFSGLKIDRWMSISNQETFIIPLDKIITMTEVNTSIELFYTKSLNQLIKEEETYKIKNLTNEKDRIIERARIKLEKIFKEY